MAVEFDVKGTRTSEYLFLPEQLTVDPSMNGRHELPDIEWLIDSILKPHGQIQPVSIRRSAGQPTLTAGFSRWRAVSEINKRQLTNKPLQLRCVYTALTEVQAFLANIEENRVRNATTPMDDAYNIQRLVNVYQMTEEEVAQSYRTSVAWVKGRLQLIEATPELEKAIRDGHIKGSAAQAIAKLSKEHQRNLAKIAEEKGKVTAQDVKREIGASANGTGKRASMRPQKVSKLRRLADEVMRFLDEEELAGDGEYITAERASLKRLLEAIV